MLFPELVFALGQCPIYAIAQVQAFLAAKGVKMIRHPSYLPDLTLADVFLFQRVRSELSGHPLFQYSFKTSWDRLVFGPNHCYS
jgi:hypothetical protein